MPNNALVALDDGHGMQTAGKRSPANLGPVMPENEFNRAAVEYARQALERSHIKTMLTAPGDDDVSLNERVRRAKKEGVKVLVSVHANAGGGTGIETFYRVGDTKAERLARLVNTELVAVSKLRDRGTKTNNLYMTRVPSGLGITSCLCECGFMDTASDLTLLRMDWYRRSCGEAIAKAVCAYTGITYVTTNLR